MSYFAALCLSFLKTQSGLEMPFKSESILGGFWPMWRFVGLAKVSLNVKKLNENKLIYLRVGGVTEKTLGGSVLPTLG